MFAMATGGSEPARLSHKKPTGRARLSAQRRLGAWIGQLLGSAPGRGKTEMNPHADSFERTQDRHDFRLLGRHIDFST